MKALSAFGNAFKIPELRKKILFTLFILVIYRLGCHITTPGVDTGRLNEFFANNSNKLFGLYDSFTGGAFQNATIFALGIMPYISASIILQLMGAVIPSLQALQKEGGEGRAKINQWTRYLTVGLSMAQAFAITSWFSAQQLSDGKGLLLDAFSEGSGNLGFKLLTTLTMTTGTVFIMWLGEQINSRGLGNGISIIILIGIISSLPTTVFAEIEQFQAGNKPIIMEIITLAVVIAIVAFIIFVEQGQRRIPIQSPRRVTGQAESQAQNSYLPLKVNTAGVIPVIFASAILSAIQMLSSLFEGFSWSQNLGTWLNGEHWVYWTIFSILTIFFAFFYTSIQLNPSDVADNLKKSGGFIPGIRPGRQTAEYIDKVLTRITLPGALFLAFISVAPFIVMKELNMSFYIGGTSVLIVVGVALDTLRQLESQLQDKNYEGFLNKGRIRGRSSAQ
jgi:preprotein translocase subunit SecY